ncbi:HET-domain-containing protein [Xylariaceae sp. FL1272]|nr:HET-domain-containing protein [Xylariaceae sp. FL1272]
MWLLRISNLERVELEAFTEGSVPEYAILSHTWSVEEVSFQDLQLLGRRQWTHAMSQTASAIKEKRGYQKLRSASELAARNGYDYIWIDTCCIDKTSSAELSEAINSMFRWYKEASICYAFLEDVEPVSDESHDFYGLCHGSRWFTRGWTLQELIAPADVWFFTKHWRRLGCKASDHHVSRSLARITGIDLAVLQGVISPSEMSIASRMKWASQRQTTRIEDIAYCLMGLFDVNMPLLYGEGRKAFIRLQEEILKTSNDQSFFIWDDLGPGAGTVDYLVIEKTRSDSGQDICGLLAHTPYHFANVQEYVPMPPSLAREIQIGPD